MVSHPAPDSTAAFDKGDPRQNKLQPGDRPFHDWYRFVLSYPPHLVRTYMDRFHLGDGAVILDPFCGTGTTLVEAKKQGCEAIGIEAAPMAHFASQTKTCWAVDLAQLETMAERVLTQAQTQIDQQPWLTFSDAEAVVVMKNAISPQPLHQCLVLRNAIAQEPDTPARDVLRLALAAVTVYEASNLKFGPEVGIRRKKREQVAVLEAWRAKVATMAADLAQQRSHPTPPAHCHHGDARMARSLLAPQNIDAVITSPPYPNEKDYTRATRLESVLLGFIRSKQELRAFKQGLIRSNSRNVYAVDDDDRLLDRHSQVVSLAASIEAKRLALQKTSGFERQYHRVTALYFGGMKRHLLDLQPALRPGAKLAYVVGDQASFFQILIRTGELLAEIAEEAGYKVINIDLFRTRGATATGAQLREEVVLLEWPGRD
jgi:hypothetical protein